MSQVVPHTDQSSSTAAGTRPSRLRSLTRPGDAEPNQMSTANSTVPQHLQGSSETTGSGLTHPRGSLTVRTRVKSELGSDGSGSARTPGSVNIRVWKVGCPNRHHADYTSTMLRGILWVNKTAFSMLSACHPVGIRHTSDIAASVILA